MSQNRKLSTRAAGIVAAIGAFVAVPFAVSSAT
ncbi:transglycosylase, partial [Nocardia elegans]|nr:transglycosylase [Nocardia elegans]